MKRLFYILPTLLLYVNTAFSQDYQVEYNHVIKFETNTTEAVYRLETIKDQSVYYLLKNEYKELNCNDVVNVKEGVVPFVLKNFSQKKMVNNQPIINKIYLISETLPLQTWKFDEGERIIKSFTCKKATSIFRGRTYIAWYTEDMSIIGGPWKFDGLPGLILAIASDDGVLNIEAVKIEKKKNKELAKFEYKEDKLISWKDYCLKYNEVINRIKKNMKADSDTDVEYNLKLDLVETIGL